MSHRASREIDFVSPDGLRLRGTRVDVEDARGHAILVHGGGVTREEGGFFTRLAAGLAVAGFASLRFDFRGHGESDGRQEDIALSGVANDIRAAVDEVREVGKPIALIAASFSGGIAVLYASLHPVDALVLLNPLLNYRRRFIDDKPYWHDGYLNSEESSRLSENGSIKHSSTFSLGRPLLNEVFYLDPISKLGTLAIPTLLVHGTRDTFIPVGSSRAAAAKLPDATMLEIDGAQHGIAVHDDPSYADPQTQEWQSYVIESVASWIARVARE